MANRIEFVADLDSRGVTRGLAQMEAAYAAANGRMNSVAYKAKKYAELSPEQIQSRKDYEARLAKKAAGAAAYKEGQEKLAATRAADAAMVESNRNKLNSIIAAEKEAGIALQAEQDAEVLMREKAEAEKLAATRAAEVARVNLVARGFGARTGFGEHNTSIGGVVQEVAVLGHEVLQGRGTGRILGSISILGQRLGWLRKIIHTTADEDIKASIAAAKKSQIMSATADAAEKSREAHIAASMATGLSRVEAEKLAAAQTVEADTARAAALAQEKLSVKLAEQAAISKASAKIIWSPWLKTLGIATVGVLAIAAAADLAYRHAAKLAEKLSGLKPGDFVPEYIARRFQGANMNAEGERKVAEAVQEQVAAYTLAEEANRRNAEITKNHYEHLLKINDLQKETALAGITNARTRAQIEKEFAQKAFDINERRRQQEEADQKTAIERLKAEASKRKEEADAIGGPALPSKHRDEQDIARLKSNIDAAKNVLDEIEKEKNSPGHLGINGRDLFRAYTSAADISQKIASSTMPGYAALKKITGGQSVTTADLDAAEEQMRLDKSAMEQAHKDAINRMADNDLIREQKEKARKSEENAAVAAIKAEQDLGDMQKKNAQARQDDADELAETFKAIDAGTKKQESSKDSQKNIAAGDSLVRVGNFLSTAKSGIENIAAEHVKIAREHLQVAKQTRDILRGASHDRTHFSAS